MNSIPGLQKIPQNMNEKQLKRAIKYIEEHPAYIIGYIEALEESINKMRAVTGAKPMTPFLDRFR